MHNADERNHFFKKKRIPQRMDRKAILTGLENNLSWIYLLLTYCLLALL